MDVTDDKSVKVWATFLCQFMFTHAMQEAAAKVLKEHKRVDILVNNAGAKIGRTLLHCSVCLRCMCSGLVATPGHAVDKIDLASVGVACRSCALPL